MANFTAASIGLFGVAGSGSTPNTNATFTFGNNNNSNFCYQMNYGTTLNANENQTSFGTATPTGTNSWTTQQVPLPVFVWPMFAVVPTSGSPVWQKYDQIVITTNAQGTFATCTSVGTPPANITIQIIGGGGGA